MKKIIAALAALTLSMSAMAQNAMDEASKMYPGWNLGNTMEACPCNWLSNELDWETGWQSTKTTQEIINYVKAQGFKSVRIPVAWYMHADANHNISEKWMNRVQEIVDYCMNADLYVVMNDHWDNGWVENSFGDLSSTTIKKNCETMNKLWTQIANRFKDYDKRLIFAGLNEPAVDNADKMKALVQYEQAFIDAVRATGGNNSNRILVVQGPATDIDKTSTLFTTLPVDKAENKLMVEVHFYSPWNFCGMDKDESWGNRFFYWGKENYVSGSKHNATWGEESYVAEEMQKMKAKYTEKGIPVIIGEYGCTWLSSVPSGENQDKHNASVSLWYATVTKEAINNGCVPFVWDTGNILERATKSEKCPYAMTGIINGANAAKWPYQVSAIEKVKEKAAAKSSGTAYNLNGTKVGEGYKGVTIVNGKKIAVR